MARANTLKNSATIEESHLIYEDALRIQSATNTAKDK